MKDKRQLIKKAVHIFVLLILSSVIGNTSIDLYSTSVFLLVIYGYAVFAWINTTKKVFSLFFIFFVYCAISMAGNTLLYVLNIDVAKNFEQFNIYTQYPLIYVIKTLTFQGKCAAFTAIGALIVAKPKKNDEQIQETALCYETKKLNIVDLAYLVLCCVMFVAYITKIFARSTTDYQEFYYGAGIGSGVSTHLTFLFYVFLYASYYRHVNDSFRRVIYLSSVILGIMMMVVGTRGLAIPIIFGLLFVRTQLTQRKTNFSFKTIIKLSLAGLLLIYCLQAMKVLRGYSLNEWNAQVLNEAFGLGAVDAFVNVVSEMGGSARCLTQTIVEIQTGATGENTLLFAVLKALIPVDIIESMNLGTTVDFLSVWVTKAGGGMKGTASWGYSIFAEAYFNFGDIGHWSMFAFGMVWVLLERFAQKLISKNYILAAMGVVYLLSYAIFLARAELLLMSTTGRYVLYLLIIMFVLKTLMPKQIKNV